MQYYLAGEAHSCSIPRYRHSPSITLMHASQFELLSVGIYCIFVLFKYQKSMKVCFREYWQVSLNSALCVVQVTVYYVCVCVWVWV